MPTVSWILEDAWERYFDALPAIEPASPAPPRFDCPFCGVDLASTNLLLGHLAEHHRGERPILLLDGVEPDQRQRLAVAVSSQAIALRNCSAIAVAIDGAAAVAIPPENLPTLLERQRDAVLNLVLQNQFDPVAQPVRQSYQLEFRVPDRLALDAVDRAFKRHLAIEAPDFQDIDDFLSNPDCGGLVQDYADALAAYVRGLLVKDRPADAAVTLPYSHYRDLYGSALNRLRIHRRPLAWFVCAVIRFARNDFRFASQLTGFPPLDGANATLARLVGQRKIEQSEAPTAHPTAARVNICPLDDGVSRVLELWARLRSRPRWTPVVEEECRQAANALSLDVPDQDKALALWAEAALRLDAHAAAQEPLALLSAVYPFGTWASDIRERNHE